MAIAPAQLTFAVADIHGRADLLWRALVLIAAYRPPSGRTIVFLGDYIDRGPASREVLDLLMTGHQDGATWVCLKGNHEGNFVANWAGRDADLPLWLANGGEATLASFGVSPERWRGCAAAAPYAAWIARLPLYHQDRHRVFVHAGMEAGVPLAAQSEKTLTLKGYVDGCPTGYEDPLRGPMHLVHGHYSNDRHPQMWARGRVLMRVRFGRGGSPSAFLTMMCQGRRVTS